MKKIYAILTIFILFISCSIMDPIYLQKDIKRALLKGKVITEEGLPLEGVTVTLTDYVTTKTDINGVFLFNFMKYGKFKIKFEKEDYLAAHYELTFNLKNRKLPFVKVKMFSLNYLINEGFELLKEKRYDKAYEIIEKIEEINNDEDTFLYLKSIYYYEKKMFNESKSILEELKDRDRNNIYYQLTLAKVYNSLELYDKQIIILIYIAKNNTLEYFKLFKEAADVYKDKLNDNDKYEELMKEYNVYKEKYNQ